MVVVTIRLRLHKRATACGRANPRPVKLLNPSPTTMSAAITGKGSGMSVKKTKRDLNDAHRSCMNSASGLSTAK